MSQKDLDNRIDTLIDDIEEALSKIYSTTDELSSLLTRTVERVETINKTLEEIPQIREAINVLLAHKETLMSHAPVEPGKNGVITNNPVPIVHQCPHCSKLLTEPLRNPSLWKTNLERHIRKNHPERLFETHTTTEEKEHNENNVSDTPHIAVNEGKSIPYEEPDG